MRKKKFFKWSRRKTKLTALLLVPLIIVAAVILFVKTMSSPADGTVSQKPTSQTVKKDAAATPGLYSGKYISFTYPSHFQRNGKKTGYGYLEVAGFSATDHTSKEITVGVQRDTLATNSGVSYRRAHPELYREDPNTTDRLVFISTKSGYERTAFIVHNDLIVSVSTLAPNGNDLKAESELILNSLEWLQ